MYPFVKEVHPGDLKNSVGEAINKLLAPIIKNFDNEEMRALTEAAYSTKKPDAKPKKGKISKRILKGTWHRKKCSKYFFIKILKFGHS